MKDPGDENDKYEDEIEKNRVDEEWIKDKNYPEEATLIINPCDPLLPDEQKVSVFYTHQFGPELYANVKYLGGVDYVDEGKDHFGFQVAVIPSPYTSPDKGRVAMVSDLEVVEHDDLELALKVMKKRIKKKYIPQVDQMMIQDIKRWLKAKKEKKNIDMAMGTNRMGSVGNPTGESLNKPYFLFQGVPVMPFSYRKQNPRNN